MVSILLIKKDKAGFGIFVLILGVLLLGFSIMMRGDWESVISGDFSQFNDSLVLIKDFFVRLVVRINDWWVDTYTSFIRWFKDTVHWQG